MMVAVPGEEDSQAFFENPKVREKLQAWLLYFRANFRGESAKPLMPLEDFLWRSLHFLDASCVQVDNSCRYTIEKIGPALYSALDFSDFENEQAIENLAVHCYMVVCEAQVLMPNGLPEDVLSLMGQVREYKFSSDKYNVLVKYAQHEMVANVLRSYIHKPEVKAISNLPSLLKRGESFSHQLNGDLNKKIGEVKKIRKSLDEYEQAFNFVGLNRSFRSMRAMKVAEVKRNFYLLVIMAVLMIVPLSIKVATMALSGSESREIALQGEFVEPPIAPVEVQSQAQEVDIEKGTGKTDKKDSSGKSTGLDKSVQYFREVMNVLVTIGLELLLLYLFKVCLQSFRSLKSQLLQLDLRIALCQFILKYSELSKKLRSEDGSAETLIRFEQVIFSGIVSGESEIPSTFDGLEQMVKILDKIKP
ncbi:hypothetical protein [Pseudomonas plecoglossicida]|uniref:hypothetical protein n=1 Tax=Pseudomonas plecoglossicida TaxID=70775 RepID=UPI0015E42CC4|nr:hypothetical protein [Pseudomonas plecoglossicida]MBA1321228.1 hypothetical protein [Pseudomonas plecoglossicida]